jgi:hypothetical protein
LLSVTGAQLGRAVERGRATNRAQAVAIAKARGIV